MFGPGESSWYWALVANVKKAEAQSMFRYSWPWPVGEPLAVAEHECVRLAYAEAMRQGLTINTYRLEADHENREIRFAAETIR